MMFMAGWKLSQEQVEEAVRLYAAGVPVGKIAERYGVDRKTIIYHARKRGLPPRQHGSGETRHRVVELARQGLSDREIAERLGLSLYTVRAYRLRAGIRRGPPPRNRVSVSQRLIEHARLIAEAVDREGLVTSRELRGLLPSYRTFQRYRTVVYGLLEDMGYRILTLRRTRHVIDDRLRGVTVIYREGAEYAPAMYIAGHVKDVSRLQWLSQVLASNGADRRLIETVLWILKGRPGRDTFIAARSGI